MAGIVSGISNLAVGPSDARRRQTQTQTQAQSNPNTNNTSTTPTPSTPTPSAEKPMKAYCNAGKQNIKGLTNQTGYVKGNANGVINFSTLTCQRQA